MTRLKFGFRAAIKSVIRSAIKSAIKSTMLAGLLLATVLGVGQVATAEVVREHQVETQEAADARNLDMLRQAMTEAYTKQSVSGLTGYLHPDVIVIFPDGQVLRGRQALVDYSNSKLQGPDSVLQSFASNPQVVERIINGDTAISHGVMNDSYVLKGGESFNLDSKFTVTAVKLPDGPANTGGWVVRSFHSSSNVFDGPILKLAVQKTMTPVFIGGAVIGVLVGALVTFLILRRKTKA